jgi:hypothetical protein
VQFRARNACVSIGIMPPRDSLVCKIGGAMSSRHLKRVVGLMALGLAALACTMQAAAGNPAGTVTSLSGTLSAVQTGTAAALTAAAAPAPLPGPPATAAASITPAPPTAAPQNPTVTTLALCWTGPGNAYPVVSSVKAGTAVELIGVGSVPGWFIIPNPKYHDPCWIEAKNVKIDPNYNLSTLRVYNPPPTPGPTETAVPTPT